MKEGFQGKGRQSGALGIRGVQFMVLRPEQRECITHAVRHLSWGEDWSQREEEASPGDMVTRSKGRSELAEGGCRGPRGGP